MKRNFIEWSTEDVINWLKADEQLYNINYDLIKSSEFKVEAVPVLTKKPAEHHSRQFEENNVEIVDDENAGEPLLNPEKMTMVQIELNGLQINIPK